MFKKIALATIAVAFIAPLVAEACNKASRRQHVQFVESTASTTPIQSSSGCVGKQAVAVYQAAPVTVTYQVAASSGCQGYQASAGCQGARVGIFRNGPLQRIHDRRQARKTVYVPVEAPAATAAKPQAKCTNPDCKCGPDCKCVDCVCDPQTAFTPATAGPSVVRICDENGCRLVPLH